MSYYEPQWTPITILTSQIIQAFNLEGNQNLVRQFGRPYRSVESVLLQAVDRISHAMGPQWTIRAKQLIMSDQLVPALQATQKVLEEITKD